MEGRTGAGRKGIPRGYLGTFQYRHKKIHDKRQDFFNNLEAEYEKNWEKKQEIIGKIQEIAGENYDSHQKWQQKIKDIESLREAFFNAGKVPRNKNQETWNAFKENVRKFNRNKNAFYKNLKKEQYTNLEKKKELIQIAEDNQDSDDFKTVTPLMKKIQSDWKKIGHVPRKDSDKVWKQFKKACNHYFDRLHAQRNEDNKEEIEAFDKKKEILDRVKAIELSGNKKEDLDKIKTEINNWKDTGRVPYNKRFIEGKFNKALDQLFNKMDIDNTKAEMLKYEKKFRLWMKLTMIRKSGMSTISSARKLKKPRARSGNWRTTSNSFPMWMKATRWCRM